MIYIAYAFGGQYEDKWDFIISIRFDKKQADKDAQDYKDLALNNNKIRQDKYDELIEKEEINTEDGIYDEVLSQELYDISSSIFYDFRDVKVVEYETDKLFYDKDSYREIR